MKKLFYFFYVLLLCSCTTEFTEQASDEDGGGEIYFSRLGDSLPQNSDNAYDYAGRIHNEILNAYYGGSCFPTSVAGIAQVVDSLANLNAEFAAIKGSSYVSVPVIRIEYLLTDRDSTIARVLKTSGLSNHASILLEGFMADLDDFITVESEYDSIHSFIATFEADVAADTLLTTKEKEVLLTTTSIARHSVYMKKKRPKKNQDPDWDWLTANIMGGTDGAVTGTAEAIAGAVVTGIADNE